MIFTRLLPHQVHAVDWFFSPRDSGTAGAYFMFPGTGKSLIALSVVERIWSEHSNSFRILITSDKTNAINTWIDQINRHTDYDVVVRPTKKEQLQFRGKPLCIVINYECLKARRDLFEGEAFDVWIGDESSEFKDQRTDKYKALLATIRTVPYRIVLNGSVITERLEDIWAQIHLICLEPSLLLRIGRTMTQFKARYMDLDRSGYGWVPKRSAFTRVRKDIGNLAYWLENDGTVQMPEKNYITVPVMKTEAQRGVDNELMESFSLSFEGETVDIQNAAALFVKRVQLAGGIVRKSKDEWFRVPTDKTRVLTRIIRDNPDSQIIVWHQYIPETELIHQHLSDQGIEHAVLTESSDTHTLEAFALGKVRVLLVRLSLCKGLNQLVGADVAVYYSSPFAYARRVQSEGRTCRITSTGETTTYFDLITVGGADEIVHQFIQRKENLSLTMGTLSSILHPNRKE